MCSELHNSTEFSFVIANFMMVVYFIYDYELEPNKRQPYIKIFNCTWCNGRNYTKELNHNYAI